VAEADKRRYPRLPVNLPATYTSSRMGLDVRVSNLSQTGLSLRCSDVDPVGTTVDLALTIPTEPEPLCLRGRVIWIRSDPDRDATVGIAFEELAESAQLAIANFVLRSSGARAGD
jgi:hypothetical protein